MTDKTLVVNTIIQHDVTKDFPLPDGCIDVVITSPPYWGLRDYGDAVATVFGGDLNCNHNWNDFKRTSENKRLNDNTLQKKSAYYNDQTQGYCSKCGAWKGQLGLEPHPQMYIDHLVQIFREVKRVLKKSGSFYLNLGDTYFGKPKSSTEGGLQNKNYGNKESKHGYDIRGGNYCNLKNTSNWLVSKQLMLIPVRVAIALQDDGWILRNDIIWHKPNPMPSSVKDRLNNTFEHVFHFVKSRKYYYDLDAIREPHKEIDVRGAKRISYNGKSNPSTRLFSENADFLGQYPSGKNPGDVIEGGAVLGESGAIKVPGGKGWTKKIPGGGAACAKDPRWCPPDGKNPGDFWDITTQPFTSYSRDLEHFAVFPKELIIKPLKASCPSQICKKCGKPRIKIIERTGYPDPDNNEETKGRFKSSGKPATDTGRRSDLSGTKHRKFKLENPDKIIGYSSCNCNAGFNSGVVLDPFCGRGTVGRVAKELGLNYVLFDISPDYCELAHLYVNGQKRKLIKNQGKLKNLRSP